MIEHVGGPDTGTAAPAEIRDRLGAVLDSVADGVTVQDRAGRIVYANAPALRVIGFETLDELLAASPDELLRRFELFDERGRPLPIADLPGRLALAGMAEPATTVRSRTVATGEERWSLVSAKPLVGPDGEVLYAINTFHDITERVRMEAEIRASEVRYRQLVEAMPQMAWTTDAAGALTLVNDRWMEYTGTQRELQVRLELDESVHPDDRDALRDEWTSSLATGTPLEAAFRFRRRDGVYRWHLVRAVPIRDEGGKITAWIGTGTDIDEAKRAEEGLRLLAEATIRLDATLDLAETVDAAAEIAVPTLADWCFIDLIGPDDVVRRLAVATSDAGAADVAAALRAFPTDLTGDSPVVAAIRDGQPAVIPVLPPEFVDLIARTPEHAELLRRVAPASAVALPLKARGRTLGAILLVATRSGRRFDAADLGAASDFARRAALAISNAELYAAEQQARVRAEAAADRTARLQRTTRALADAASTSHVFEIVLAETCEATGARAGAIVLREGETVVLAAGRGLDHDAVERFRGVPLDADLAAVKTVRTGDALWVSHVAEARIRLLVAGLSHTRGGAACAVPLSVDGVTTGALTLAFDEPREFSADDRDFIVAHANLAAQALKRAELSDAREDALRSLEDQRSRLETVLRQMPAGVLICDADGRLVLSNAQATEIWREPIEPGRSIAEYLEYVAYRPDGDRYEIDEWPLARALRLGDTITGEPMEIERFDGTRGWIAVDAAPVRDRVGRIVAAVSTFSDVTQAREAAARQTFLADATSLLASSLDYETTIQRLAMLAVPRIADWCAIDLVGADGELERPAIAHIDPAKVALARELREEYPQQKDAPTGTWAVMRSGEPEFVGDIPASAFEAIEDAKLRSIMEELELHSYMCVPLIAGGETLGALTLIGAESGRRFTPDDLALAEDLARRAASAVQNARLFRDVGR
ncbi:MAG: PAS domain S-box protein, partial [Chloroflexota bacterium]